ncbi:trypsin-like serine protease [Conidiobolus coronatus NRRL 28638]|uniref:Trypsin-like serine protease n=1 Tax=Conidiobolus coronatus (strain ATCC 28846 / CBS 209.66 / NRRL 28638) TaxID=796925 RepID=A0A137P9G6_CONC2|nr:trypsin-like serine protease [Conidiobolus coronatus NRRL 28638]|eukprot:KXN71594.1 trypsin-like serine protease [Conidiobolus coronatus NRRL 28638]
MSISSSNLSYSDSISKIRATSWNEVNPPFKYPFMVRTVINGKNFCGGVLYNANTVITAATCSILWEGKYTAEIHRHNTTRTVAEEGAKVYSAKEIIVHPDFDYDTLNNNIAIWKLNSTEDNSEVYVDLDPGPLGNQAELSNTVIGWGYLDDDNKPLDTLQEVELPIVDSEKCKNEYKKVLAVNATTMICVGIDDGSHNLCYGDVGGPLGVLKNDRFTLVGIGSYGITCGEHGYPEIFTRVSNYLDWIKSFAN